jgi:predicted flap endonuclease-1-like 5' DNA nuclease
MRPTVYKPSGMREGKGFTLKEFIEAGLTEKDVLKLMLPFDRRRKTTHSFNIELLKKMKEEAGKVTEVMPEIKEVREEPELKEAAPTPKRKAGKPKEKKEKKPVEKSTEKKEEKVTAKKGEGVPLTELKGVGEKKAQEFAHAGIKDVDDLLSCDPVKVAGKTSFSEEYIIKLKKEAEKI